MQLKVLIYISISQLANSMLSNTGSTESIVKYIVYRLSTTAAILFYWITMKAVQQLTGLTQAGPMDRPIIRPVSYWTRPWNTRGPCGRAALRPPATESRAPAAALVPGDRQTNTQTYKHMDIAITQSPWFRSSRLVDIISNRQRCSASHRLRVHYFSSA